MATFSMSTVAKGSDEFKDFCCSTCEEQSVEVVAEFYCETCSKFYCGKCIHHHGQLFKKHSPYGRGDMNKWPISKKVEDFLMKCEVHKDKKLEIFCEDHGQLCCSNCILLNHRQCTKVTLVSECVKTQSTDLQQFAVKLQTIQEQMNNLQTNWETSIKSLQGSYDEQLHKIQETRRKVNDTLDNIEKITLKEMKNTLTNLQASLKTDVNNCRRLRDDLKILHEAIQDISDMSMKELSFIASKKCSDKIQQSETYLKENSVQVKSSLTFQPNSDIEQYLSKLSGLGRVVHSTQPLTVQGNPDQVLTVKGESEYNVRIPSDSSACFIRGICVLPDGQILVVDSRNKKLKLLDQQYRVLTHCDVSTDSWDMCHITLSEVAVTVNDSNTCGVQLISVNNGQLVKGRKLQLQHYCRGIAHHQGELYVTDTTALYKYTLSGKLVSKLYKDTSRGDKVCQCAVSPSGDRIYISNQSQHKLLTLARDGSVLSTLEDPQLHGPDAVHVTPAGQVLVCGWLSHAIIQVDREGRKKLATLATRRDGVGGPASVCYNRHTASIIVGRYDNNNILVFKVQ